jgi:L-threonylcarbamoyladenylate synthase
MSARVLHVDPASPREERLRTATGILEAGEVVALPTETFYGLAVDAFAPRAVRRLNELKRKPEDSPALLLVSSPEQVAGVAGDLPELFHRLAAAFWPGPLTLVVGAADRLPPEVSGGRGTVAVRVPGLNLPRRLAAALGRPITGVSANLHGETPCRTPGEVARAFPEGVAMILDGGPAPGGAVSTILDLSTEAPRVVREGAVPLTALAPFVPEMVR